jgi:hypothetical protein
MGERASQNYVNVRTKRGRIAVPLVEHLSTHILAGKHPPEAE